MVAVRPAPPGGGDAAIAVVGDVVAIFGIPEDHPASILVAPQPVINHIPGKRGAVVVVGRVGQQEVALPVGAAEERPIQTLVGIVAADVGISPPLERHRAAVAAHRVGGTVVKPGAKAEPRGLLRVLIIGRDGVAAVADGPGGAGGVPAGRGVIPQLFAEFVAVPPAARGRAHHAHHGFVREGGLGGFAQLAHEGPVVGARSQRVLMRAHQAVLRAPCAGPGGVPHRLRLAVHAHEHPHQGHRVDRGRVRCGAAATGRRRHAVVPAARLGDEILEPGLERGVAVLDAPVHIAAAAVGVREGSCPGQQPGRQVEIPVGRGERAIAAPVIAVYEPLRGNGQAERLADDASAAEGDGVGRGRQDVVVVGRPVDVVAGTRNRPTAGGRGAPDVVEVFDRLQAQRIPGAGAVKRVVGGAGRRHSLLRRRPRHEDQAAGLRRCDCRNGRYGARLGTFGHGWRTCCQHGRQCAHAH